MSLETFESPSEASVWTLFCGERNTKNLGLLPFFQVARQLIRIHIQYLPAEEALVVPHYISDILQSLDMPKMVSSILSDSTTPIPSCIRAAFIIRELRIDYSVTTLLITKVKERIREELLPHPQV